MGFEATRVHIPYFGNLTSFASRALLTMLWYCSPVNMALQYMQYGWWNDRAHGFVGGGYLFGERMYQVLSLVSKSLLLWLVVGGSNQPNANSSS